ncbi:endonuclease/exonuclease/phosphatase family protein [Ilumatobacter nonamiensis]|uniref:endonuclease/exonuclease/phosphatase family protein n=1 Tax=Ilumatobacter nonamiensis TaxID=467093 RepID=UPI00130E5286|nr:endonuclease/exonuclease/phosphatase family protein [Ilumatobacter nonamiensis]
MSTGRAEWTVMTWNLQGAKRTDLDRVVKVIAGGSPDVVLLQEIREPQADQLAEELSMTAAWVEKHHPFRPFHRTRAEGAATLTPHTLDDAGHARISDAMSMRSYRRRIVQWALIERGDGSACRTFNVHLSPHDFEEERRIEANRVNDIALSFEDGYPIVVGGDFNDADTGEIVDILPGVEHVPSPPTNPSGDPTDRLDHVLVPSTAVDVSVFVPAGGAEWSELSDHLPLTVQFTLAEDERDEPSG